MAKEDYLVITDAASDIIPYYADQEGIRVIPMEVTMTDGYVFDATYNSEHVSLADFYEKIRSGLFAQTSAITPERYRAYLTPLLEEGHDILYNCFTSGMSSTYNNACMVAAELREQLAETQVSQDTPETDIIHCPVCGAELPKVAMFCGKCGRRLS